MPRVSSKVDGCGFFQFVREMVRNPLATIPSAAYEAELAVLRIGGIDVAYIASPDILENILINRTEDFPKSDIDERVFKPAIGDSLLIASGEDWRQKRRHAAPHFTPTSLAKAVPKMVTPLEALTEDWRTRGPMDREISTAMTAATLEVICGTLFSNPDKAVFEDISKALQNYLAPISWTIAFASLRLPAWLPHPGKTKIHRARRLMRRRIRDVIADHRMSTAAYDDVFSGLIRTPSADIGASLTDDDAADLLLTLIAAGHETSANGLTWILFCLAEQPGLQTALRADVARIAGDRTLHLDDYHALETTQAFIRETLRLFPPAPLMARRTTLSERFGGYDFSPGTTLIIPIYAIHRHKELWSSPNEFDLRRFSGEQAKLFPRFAYMPFGAGPRTCIGSTLAMMEMTLATATLVRGLEFLPSVKTRCDPVQRVTLRPRNGMWLKTQPV